MEKIIFDSVESIEMFTWVKDTTFRFTSCSENLAALAGEDSPSSIIGKDDFNLIWRKEAALFRKKDSEIIEKQIHFFKSIECIDAVKDGKTIRQKILITKTPIVDKSGKCIGIAGSHINLPDELLFTSNRSIQDIAMPSVFGDIKITKRESEILKFIFMGKTSKQIAKTLGISYKTVEDHTRSIKIKFQCNHKNELISLLFKYGVHYLL